MKKFSFVLLLVLLVSSFMAQNIPSYIPKNGLVGYWPFNGNANDESGNAHNLINNGAILEVDRNGNSNNAYSLSTGGNLSFKGKSITGGESFTYSFWMKTNKNLNEYQDFIFRENGVNEVGHETGVWFFFHPNTKDFGIVNPGNSYAGILRKNFSYIDEWHHVVVQGPSQYKIYVDGKLFETSTSDYKKFADTCTFQIGGFHGSIDDFVVHNRQLTLEEISALYTGSSPSPSIPSYVPKDGLLGYWPFNGNANDESGNGYHGTVNGATLTTDRFGNLNKAYLFQPSSPSHNISTNYVGILGNNNRSISLWFYQNSDISNDNDVKGLCIYGGGTPNSQFSLQIYKNRVGLDLSNCTSFYEPNTYGKWNHYVITYNNIDGNGVQSPKIYLNGVLLSTISNSYNLPGEINTLTGINFLIGGGSQINQFNGKMDDVAFYNRALTEQEISALYTSTSPCSNTTSAITTSDSTTFCQGGSALLTAAVTTASTPIYQWYLNDQAITNATQNNYKATTAGKYTVKVVDGACEAVSLPKEVTVNPLPTATISPSGNVSTICEGSSLTLVADGGVSYKWNTGSTENKITVSKKGPYYADVINQFGCKSVVWRDVVVKPLPIVTINNLKQIAFKNDSAIQLEGAPKGGVFTGEGVNGNTFNPEKAALGKKAIIYTYSTTNGCKGEAKGTILLVDSLGNVCSSTKYDTVKVNTYDTITVTNSVTKYDTVKVNTYDTITVTNNITKYDTITVTNNVTKYDTVIINQTKYDTITLTDTVSILKIKFKLTTGIFANQLTSMSLYPNPTSDILHIEIGDAKAMEGYRYRILDALGKEVYNEFVKTAITEIPLKTLGATGMYQFEVLDAKNVRIQSNKIVLQ